MSFLMTCTSHQILFGDEIKKEAVYHAWERRETPAGCGKETQRKETTLEIEA
jgi:hypothetical protein